MADAPAGWATFGARVRGRKHKLDGTNCDDAFAFRQVGSWTVIAVSDGAGSKKYSRIGAKLATAAAVDHLEEFFKANEPILRTTKAEWDVLDRQSSDVAALSDAIGDAMARACAVISTEAKIRSEKPEYAAELGRPLDDQDFSCTLLIAVLRDVVVDGVTEQFIAFSQVGDGMIGAIDRTGQAHVLGFADSGGHAGETEFLTSEGKATREFLQTKTNIKKLDLQALLVMSDGVADDYFPGDAELPRLWADLLVNAIPAIDDAAPATPLADCSTVLETIAATPQSVTLQSSALVAASLQTTVPELSANP